MINDNTLTSVNYMPDAAPGFAGNYAILLDNAVVDANTNAGTEISDNTIDKYEIAIYARRLTKLSVLHNIHVTNYGKVNSSYSWYSGAWLESCDHSFVKNNTFTPRPDCFTDNTTRGTFGVSLNGTTNSTIGGNVIGNGTGASADVPIFMYGNSQGSNMACNVMNGWKDCGISMKDFPSSLTLTIQLPGSHASNNQWLNGQGTSTNPRIRSEGTTKGELIEWYWKNTQGSDFNPNPINASGSFQSSLVNASGQNLNRSIDDCFSNSGFLNRIDEMNNERDSLLAGIVINNEVGNTGSEVLDAVDNYYANTFAYNALQQNPDWLSMGTAEDELYQNYFDSVGNSNVGITQQIQAEASTGNMNEVAGLVNQITNESLMDYNTRVVFNIYCSLNDTTVLSAQDSVTLSNIANSNSFIGGSAVFTARALLGLIIPEPEWTETDYRKEEWLKPEKKKIFKVAVYPNPNDGNFFFKMNEKIVEGDYYELFDQLGRKIKHEVILNQLQQVDCNCITSGIYTLKVFHGKSLMVNKVLIIK